jgi:hypothetical protein
MFERMQEDKQDGIKVDENRTGGYNTQLLLGADFNTAKWALGVNYAASIKQNLAAGQIEAKTWGEHTHKLFALSKNEKGYTARKLSRPATILI